MTNDTLDILYQMSIKLQDLVIEQDNQISDIMDSLEKLLQFQENMLDQFKESK